MALYPEISPSAPVSRDDLAAILAMQGLAGGQQPGDASSMSMAAAVASNAGGSVPGYEAGAPGPGMGIGRGAGLADPGAMTMSNASMVGDPMGESGPIGVPSTNRSGDDTSQQSQDKQAADRAALADAALGRNQLNESDPLAAATQAYGWGFNNSWGAPPDAPGGVPAGYSTTAQPGATPVSTTAITPESEAAVSGNKGWGGGLPSMYGDQFAHGAPPAGNLFEGTPGFTNFGNAVTPDQIADANTSNAAVGSILAGLGFGPGFGFGSPGSPGAGSGGRGGSTTAADNTASSAAAQGAIGSITSGLGFGPGFGFGSPGDPGAVSSPGGFTGFGATGGYEGSGSMGNTTGAPGTGGDMGGGPGGPGGGSGGEGGGAVGGFGGGGSDPGGSSPGGVG